MLQPGHLVRCPCFWPRDPGRLSPALGYLIPGPGDILRVLYVGGHPTEDTGWLFCLIVCELPVPPSTDPPRPPRCGWIPSWAVVRMRPPGPLLRRALDGQRYSLPAWLDYYGPCVGLRLWAEAPH